MLGELTSSVRAALVELMRPGEGGLAGRTLVSYGRVVVTLVIVVTNLIGAGTVLVLAVLVIPMPHLRDLHHVELVNALAAIGYVAIAVPLRRWLIEERPATATEVRLVLYAPVRLFILQVGLWLVAAVVFGVLNFRYSGRLGERVVIVVAITGVVTAACAYLATERLLRSAAARALEDGIPGRIAVPGVTTRALFAWALGTGMPMLGVVAIGILALTGARHDDGRPRRDRDRRRPARGDARGAHDRGPDRLRAPRAREGADG